VSQFARFGPVAAADLRAWRSERRLIVDGFDAGGATADAVCIGVIDDDRAAAAALDAAVAGASLAVVGGAGYLDALVDDLARLGVEICWGDDTVDADPVDDEWSILLERLAAGASVAQAARACHMSLRSAYRRLALARTVLGVSSNTAAVVARRSAANRNATAAGSVSAWPTTAAPTTASAGRGAPRRTP
jgi:hypothetical protein